MGTYNSDTVAINGSQSFLGGKIYTVNMTQGFNGQPTTMEVGIVGDPSKFQIPTLNFTTPYNIQLGTTYNLQLFAYKYCLSKGENGKILTVFFQDKTVLLRRYWYSPGGQVCQKPGIILCSKTLKSGERPDKIANYTYAEFQKDTAFLGIPSSVTSNEYITFTEQGTVLDIFNRFMDAYGYAWYLEGDVIKLINLKVAIAIETGRGILDNYNRKLSSSYCVDISNNYVKGAVALEDISGEDVSKEGDKDSAYILKTIPGIWDGTNAEANAAFLNRPLLGGYGPKAALYALQGPEIYFSYIWHKHGLQSALHSVGAVVYAERNLSEVPDVLENMTAGGTPVLTQAQVQNYKLFVIAQANDENQVFYVRDRKLGEILQQGYYVMQDGNPTVQWREGDPTLLDKKTNLTEIPQFQGLLDNKTTQKTLAAALTDYVWLLSFPQQIQHNFDKTFVEKVNGSFPKPMSLPIATTVGDFSEGKFSYILVDKTHEQEIIVGEFPDIRYPFSAIRTIRGDIADDSHDVRFNFSTSPGVATYGLGNRKIKGCNIPATLPETAYIQVETYENLSPDTQSAEAFLKQAAYIRNQSDIEFTCEIRGISIPTKITPEMGLDSIAVRMDGDNGYTTTYTLTSKIPRPDISESLKPKQKDTIN